MKLLATKILVLLVVLFFTFSCEKEAIELDDPQSEDASWSSPEIAYGGKAADGVTVFQHCGYRGSSVTLPVGRYPFFDLLARGVKNDDISSVRVPPGYEITLYADDIYGKRVTLTSDYRCFINNNFNDLTSSVDVRRINSPTTKPTWKMLTLIIKNMDASYGSQRYRGSMSANLVSNHRRVAEQIPATLKSWTNNQANATMEIMEINDPLTSVEKYGDNTYWPGPNSMKTILDRYVKDKTYSSIFICIDMGNIPTGWGGLGYYPGPNLAKGATYAILGFAEVSGFVHEWLHGAGQWYRGKGLDVPDPHDNAQYGHPNTTNGTWDYWYRDLLNARIKRNGKNVGYTPQVWNSPVPNTQ